MKERTNLIISIIVIIVGFSILISLYLRGDSTQQTEFDRMRQSLAESENTQQKAPLPYKSMQIPIKSFESDIPELNNVIHSSRCPGWMIDYEAHNYSSCQLERVDILQGYEGLYSEGYRYLVSCGCFYE